MAFTSVFRLKEDHLQQLRDSSEHDAALQRYLDIAYAVINGELGYTFAAATTTTRSLVGQGTTLLKLPADYVAGSVTSVTTLSGYTVPSYVEQNGHLVTVDSSGVIVQWHPYGGLYRYYDTILSSYLWLPGVTYTVHGSFGRGAVPDDIAHLEQEIAVALWRGRESGGIEVVSTEAAITTVRQSLTPFQQAILARYGTSSEAGVW